MIEFCLWAWSILLISLVCVVIMCPPKTLFQAVPVIGIAVMGTSILWWLSS